MKTELLDRDILRLTELLKDYPVDSFFSDVAAELADCGYLRKSRSGLTYRLTEKSKIFVNPNIDKDKYPLSKGKMLNRRIECGKTALTMYRAGINVFGGDDTIRFFPAFLIRRMGNMTLGASQLIGLLITKTKTFLTYFADKDLKVDMEIAAAKRILPLLDACDDLSAIIMCDRYRQDLYKVINQFPFDVHMVACNDTGAKQLKLLCAKAWREKLINEIHINYNGWNSPGDCPCDAIKDGIPRLYAHDMNMTRIYTLYRYAVENQCKVYYYIFNEAGGGTPYKEGLVECYVLKEDYFWGAIQANPKLYPYKEDEDA